MLTKSGHRRFMHGLRISWVRPRACAAPAALQLRLVCAGKNQKQSLAWAGTGVQPSAHRGDSRCDLTYSSLESRAADHRISDCRLRTHASPACNTLLRRHPDFPIPGHPSIAVV
ncbi:hypothetical protein BURKHO8Y_150079 [Burkholderia sp. 8Y]|nr:hypothetical protein BURKHO8Y_150079 [Burkholderia sp. 8Y]